MTYERFPILLIGKTGLLPGQIETFETISGSNPWIGNLSWYNGGTTISSVTRTTSHVTQGVYDWFIQGTQNNNTNGLFAGSGVGGATINLSGYTSLIVDMFVGTLPANSYLGLILYNPGFTQQVTQLSSLNPTGAITLTLNIASPGFSLSNVNIALACLPAVSSSGTTYNFYVDNLHAT